MRKQTTNFIQFISREQAGDWLKQTPGSVLIGK